MENGLLAQRLRTVNRLESPEQVGAKAAARAVRRLNPRKVPTQKVPVVSKRDVAGAHVGIVRCDQWIGDLPGTLLPGGSWGKRSRRNRWRIDDATISRLVRNNALSTMKASRAGATWVIERGILKNYLLNSYTARNAGWKTTGNAARAYG